ncbi:hypothetical protein EA660_08115 [Pseudoxanthomonas winnipegensis]|uniref:Uncharacterized protein n=1 Tax=Pseudoxanthomonas winnipegensis TaxID=2480810 RepID=A0A4Q8LAB8_9GAMM|nr:hypothetical protein EA660_08115 [Pseudoxanthomonas winnipegensis]
MDLIPSPAAVLRAFADDLEARADLYDRLLWRDRGERSTVAETYRTAASLARQKARRYERLAEQNPDLSQERA